MTIEANSTNMKELIWIIRVAIEVVSFPLHDDESKQHEHEGGIWIDRVAIEVVSFPLHDDQNKQHEDEGAHLDQSCRHRGCFFPAA